jgi:hypothetical protein
MALSDYVGIAFYLLLGAGFCWALWDIFANRLK